MTCDCVSRISYENIDINNDINIDSLFLPATDRELNAVRETWRQTKIASDDYEILVDQARLKIIGHTTDGQLHYTAYFLPEDYDPEQKYPVLLWLNGLDQKNPSINLEHSYLQALKKFSPEYIMVIPSFRGQALILNQKRYCSDGFFGDAYDGAATDGLRALDLAQEVFSIDSNRIAVAGQSRGGTSALLIASRDSSINTVIDVTGPVNFLDQTPFLKYGFQFRYQFLNEKLPIADLRQKIIAASPIHFISSYEQPLLCVYGKNDRIVGIENPDQLTATLGGRQNFELRLLDSGHSIDAVLYIRDWLEKNNK